jgi:hypothetical protein
LVHDAAVLRLEVVALIQVFEEVAGGAAVHAFFKQSDVNVCNQFLEVCVRLGIPADRESVKLIYKILVIDLFHEGRLLEESRRHAAGCKIPAVNQVAWLCFQWVNVACNYITVERLNGFAVVRLEDSLKMGISVISQKAAV